MVSVRAEHEDAYNQFAAWLAMTNRDRDIHGLPTSQKAFAERVGVSPHTLSRWKKDEDFQERVNEHRRLSPSVEEATPERADVDPAERDYREMRQYLLKKARDGEKWAVQDYFKMYGQPFVEAERQQLNSSFSGLSDGELHDQILSMIGPSKVREWLEDVAV